MEEIRYVEIVTKYSDMIYRIALHDCRNSQDAEDIMQTVFMKLYQKNPDFENEDHLKYWLVRVTINECRRLFTAPWKTRIDLTESPEQLEILVGKNLFQDMKAEGESEILEAVLKLPRKYRVPVYLYYYEEYSIAEIAHMLERKPSTIQTQLDRARKKLGGMLEEVGVYEGKISPRRI